MGKIIEGILFPTFTWLDKAAPPGAIWAFTSALLPKEGKDYALLFLWCFIAGFAERFIPDTLSQLTQRVSSKGEASAIASARVQIPGARALGSPEADKQGQAE